MPKRKHLLGAFSIRTILPNVVTLLAFTAGLTSIRFAFVGNFEMSLTLLLAAGIFDGLDGTVARLLKSTSRFGAELDSLSDCVAFGVAPAIVLYLWGLDEIGRFGWGVSILFATAMALRLARFNARLDQSDEPRRRHGFLTGVPAPMGAGLLMLPVMADQSIGEAFLVEYPTFIAAYALIVAMLLVSTIPTFSFKIIRVPKHLFAPFLLFIVFVIAALFARTWTSLGILMLVYMMSIPISWITFQRRVKRHDQTSL